MKMNKRLATIAAVILLVLIPAFATAGEVSWAKLVYDPSVSAQTRENFQKAIDTMDVLFTKYKIVLNDPITIVVTANDAESFIRALMVYGNASRAVAENKAKLGVGGVSSGKKTVIVIRNNSELSTPYGTPARGLFSHELFHQVQYQYSGGKNYGNTAKGLPTWLQEGSAELFKYMALEIGRYDYVTNIVHRTEQSIRKAAEIPDTRQLASYDYKDWESLMQKYPVYQMAAVMTYQLVGDDGFGKVILYYQLLDNGSDPDKAFITAFGKPMSVFLTEMNEYFNNLRRHKE
jgi:hypothetical protein